MIDQLERLNELLTRDPSTRAAFVSPWRSETDGGHGGEPCLVGAHFRAVDGALHLTVIFRSHDLFGAYPHNLAACCLWLVRTAEAHGMAVGTLTCCSFSAHVYERDWAAAQDVVEAYKPPPGPRWDPRTIWTVEAVADAAPDDHPASSGYRRKLRATAFAVEHREGGGNTTPGEGEVVAVFEAKTPETLMRDLAESGLIQEPAALLWLGGEVERVWRQK